MTEARRFVSVSDTGVMVLKPPQARDYQLLWVDRAGKPAGAIEPSTRSAVPSRPWISPDGTRVVMQRRDPRTPAQKIWVSDLARGTLDRMTTGPPNSQSPAWSFDGRAVYFSTVRDGGQSTRMDVWALPITSATSTPATGGRDPFPVLDSQFDESAATLSPDGRWLAYVSDLTGTEEVYVRRFNADGRVGEPVRVSTGSGTRPRWRRDGHACGVDGGARADRR